MEQEQTMTISQIAAKLKVSEHTILRLWVHENKDIASKEGKEMEINDERQMDMVEKMELSSKAKKVLKTIKSMGEKCQEILMLAADQMSMQEMQEITGN